MIWIIGKSLEGTRYLFLSAARDFKKLNKDIIFSEDGIVDNFNKYE